MSPCSHSTLQACPRAARGHACKVVPIVYRLHGGAVNELALRDNPAGQVILEVERHAVGVGRVGGHVTFALRNTDQACY